MSARQSQWALVPNPSYEGKTPRLMVAACHDRTAFMTVRCACGYSLHLHESQIGHVPDDAEIASACHVCHELLVFPPGYFRDAFQQMRDDGWIA